MDARKPAAGLLMAMLVAANAQAQDGDLAQGQALFNKECSVCHGLVSGTTTGDRVPVRPQRDALQVARVARGETTMDFPVPLTSAWSAEAGTGGAHGADRIAVVPLYGPHLRGVIGRTAGTVEGYGYSAAFMKKMDGKVWDEAGLDKWITSAQTIVPGSYMFYSQKKSDIRSKIIAYLKASQ
jgi:cytochrome c2